MKKLLLSTAIAAVMVLSASASQAADEGSAIAEVAIPVTIGQDTEMSFGKFAIDAGLAATIYSSGIDPDNAQQLTPAAVKNGSFSVAGGAGASYGIIVTDSDGTSVDQVTLTHTNGSNNMTAGLTNLSSNVPAVGGGKLSNPGGTDTVTIVGTLATTVGQLAGSYSGDYNVTVTYP